MSHFRSADRPLYHLLLNLRVLLGVNDIVMHTYVYAIVDPSSHNIIIITFVPTHRWTIQSRVDTKCILIDSVKYKRALIEHNYNDYDTHTQHTQRRV